MRDALLGSETPPMRAQHTLRVTGSAGLAASLAVLATLGSPALAASQCRLGDEAPCTKACDAGDLHACAVLGDMWEKGVGVAQDSRRADALFVKGCKKGDGESCNAHGDVVREKVLAGKLDWDEAFAAFAKACEHGNARGCASAASIELDGHGHLEQADGVALLRKSCELASDGSASACFDYGEVLHSGKYGVAKDTILAAKWLAKACRLGAAAACTVANELGETVELSTEQLRRIETARCTGGDVKACAHLGAALIASADASAGLEPLRAACLGEQPSACATLGVALLFGGSKGATVAVNLDEGMHVLTKACELDDAVSCRRIGDQRIVGHAVARDLDGGLAMFKKACHLGDTAACEHASAMAMAKSVKRTGDAVAETVFTKECKAGDAEACADLQGLKKQVKRVVGAKDSIAHDDVERACESGSARACFDAGTHAAKDLGRARTFFDLGCKAGYPKACNAVGSLLDVGKGGPADRLGAVDAFAKGCSLGNADACGNAAITAKKLGGDAVARARPVLEQACSARVGPACDAASRLE